MWWCELCKNNHLMNNWNDFCDAQREHFREQNLNWRVRDELVTLHKGNRQSVADFLFKIWEVYLKITDLSEAE